MNAEEAAASLFEGRGLRQQAGARSTACSHCKRRLASEYFFTCRRCEASYCYIHMSRHVPELCGRQAGRRRRAEAAAGARRGEVGVPIQGGNQLLLAGPGPDGPSSANV